MKKVRKSIVKLAATIVLLTGMTSVCFAQNNGNNNNGNGNNQGQPHTAPEIDPASASSALALLTGGLLIIRGRRR